MQIFVKVESLNSPVYSAPPCRIILTFSIPGIITCRPNRRQLESSVPTEDLLLYYDTKDMRKTDQIDLLAAQAPVATPTKSALSGNDVNNISMSNDVTICPHPFIHKQGYMN